MYVETQKILKKLGSSTDGISQDEAIKRLRNEGLNSLGTNKKFVLIKNILEQFTDLLVIILLIAAFLSMLLGDSQTAIVMLAIVGLNAAIGFTQQYRTERTISVLRNMLPHKSQVIRGGVEKEIISRYLVCGDVVILQAGDSIPADGLVLEQYSFKVNESSLTGESNAQAKKEEPSPKHPNENKIFMGTTVLEGEARILVTATGVKTEFGKIAKQTKETTEELSPLQKRLREVGQRVAKLSLAIMFAVIAYLLLKNHFIDHKTIEVSLLRNIFLFGLALAASLVPEGLPATVSVALSIGANRLIKKNAIVKKLASVETLGSTNVICTDKTGTLTVGKMSIVSVLSRSGELIDMKKYDLLVDNYLLLNWALCGTVRKSDKGLVGDSDEVALWETVESKKVNPIEVIKSHKKVHEFSFSPVRKMMSVMVENEEKFLLLSKGNPEILLHKSTLSKEDVSEKMRLLDQMAATGLRVFAFAHREFDQKPIIYKSEELEKDLTFDGFCGIADDIHPEVPEAIRYCQRAGIKIIMITGDYKVTAEATANKVNLSGGNEGHRMISGEELANMSDLSLRENLLHPVVFYQTDPGEKLRIVETLQKMGMIVAVTGDGVNDSLALKKADIGIAMGKAGTDVAKEAADMVLLDDNFATIVNAIKEGRIIWDNLRKFLFYVFSSNAGEFMAVFFGLLFGLPNPLLAVQILSVDLGTDVLPSLALTADPAAKGILERPVENKENLLGWKIVQRLLSVGLIMGGGAAFNFWLINGYSVEGTSLYHQATTAAWATLVVCQVANVFEVRGGFSTFKEAFFGNKFVIWSVAIEIILMMGVVYWWPLQNILQTVSLDFYQWAPVISVGLVFLIYEEVRRYYSIKNNVIVRNATT